MLHSSSTTVMPHSQQAGQNSPQSFKKDSLIEKAMDIANAFR
jgi:hypothetical protein